MKEIRLNPYLKCKNYWNLILTIPHGQSTKQNTQGVSIFNQRAYTQNKSQLRNFSLIRMLSEVKPLLDHFFGVDQMYFRKMAMRPFYNFQRGGTARFLGNVGLVLLHFSSKTFLTWLSRTLMGTHALSMCMHGQACVCMLRLYARFFFSKKILQHQS